MASVETLLAALERRDAAQKELDAAALNVSRALLDLEWQGTPAKELASMLEVSHQRVYQLLARARRDVEGSIRAELEEKRAAGYGMNGRQDSRGLESRSIPCFVCGRFKPRPSSTCDHCGDDPVSHNGDPREFDRAYGYA